MHQHLNQYFQKKKILNQYMHQHLGLLELEFHYGVYG